MILMANENIKRLLVQIYRYGEVEMEHTHTVEVADKMAKDVCGNVQLLHRAVRQFEYETGWEMVGGELLFGDECIQRVGLFERDGEQEEMIAVLEL